MTLSKPSMKRRWAHKDYTIYASSTIKHRLGSKAWLSDTLGPSALRRKALQPSWAPSLEQVGLEALTSLTMGALDDVFVSADPCFSDETLPAAANHMSYII
jgi:hypothetical protein